MDSELNDNAFTFISYFFGNITQQNNLFEVPIHGISRDIFNGNNFACQLLKDKIRDEMF